MGFISPWSSCFQKAQVLIERGSNYYAKSIQQYKEENNTKKTSYEVELFYYRTQTPDVTYFSHNKKYLRPSIMIPSISYGIDYTSIALWKLTGVKSTSPVYWLVEMYVQQPKKNHGLRRIIVVISDSDSRRRQFGCFF